MHQRSSISLYKFMLSRYPFQRFPKPVSSLPSKPISNLANQSLSNPIIPPSKPYSNPHTTTSNSRIHFTFSRNYSSAETDKAVDEINLKFAEAREEIEMAMESKETVYLNEEAECARAVTNEVLDMYEGLLGKLPESERGALQRSMGLKSEQLKAELDQLNE